MSQDTIIKLKNLEYKVGHKYLLRDISWEIKRGEHWAVFGMNGSGKTTLLSIIAGFKSFTKGELELYSETLNKQNILQMRKNIGWVSASFFDKYYTRESVMDIVLSGKYGTLGVENDISLDDRKRAKQLLKELHIEYCADATFDMLSKGERQNVLIARALYSNPEILILDEPCTGLDVYNREYLFLELKKIAENTNVTIIYVTHYVEEILPIFQKCLLLKDGQIFMQGSRETVLSDVNMSVFLEHDAQLYQSSNGKLQLDINVPDGNLVNLLKQ
ncbi:MAG: ATP-binding cassette domain-containing protein [Peptococcaceae bacterium]|nr:ATP-binding cassette domain-containing protein [Peptococcaceae bacterium]